MRLKRGAKLELSVVDEADGGRPAACPADSLHELDADLEVVEDETVEDLDLGDWAHAQHNFCHDTEISLAAHHDVMHIGSIRDSGPQIVLCVGSGGCHISHVAEHILNVAVCILLHPASASRDPASKRRKLARIRLVARAHSILFKVPFQILAGDTSTDAGHIVLLVDPADLVHAAHIDGDDHTSLILIQLKRLGHVGATSIWHEHDVMLHSQSDEVLHVLRRVWVQNTVSDPVNLSVPELPDFLEACSVRMHDSFPLHEGAPRELLRAKLLQELMVDYWCSNAIHIFLGRVLIVEVRAQMLRDILAELRKDLSSEHVSGALDLDLLLVLEVLEARVIVTPTLTIEVEDLDLAVRMIVNDLRVLFTIDRGLFGRDLGLIVLEVLVYSRKSVHAKFL